MRWLTAISLLAITAAIHATSLETVSYGGNTYYHATNNGSIEPQTFFNRTDLFNGQNISDALSRDWLAFGFALAYLNNGSITPITLQGLPSYNIYGYSDNSTYWRGEINRSFTLGTRTAQVSLNYWQNTFDDYINETWRLTLSASYTAPNDVYYVESLTDIRYLDSISYGNGTRIWGTWLNQTVTVDNVTSISVMKYSDARGWQYQLDKGQYGNRLLVRNGVVYIGINLGKTLSGTTVIQLYKIDANCAIQCAGGDAVILNAVYPNSMGTDHAAQNETIGAQWSDSLGLCGYTGACTLGMTVRRFYPPTSTVCWIINSSTGGVDGSNWATCAANNCTGGTTSKANAVKNQWYWWLVTIQGAYSSGTSLLLHQMNEYFGISPPLVGCGQRDTAYSVDVVQNTAPSSITCTLNGQAITNNSQNTITTTNGSLTWANLTVNCTFGNPATPFGGIGLINNSYISLNRSGWGTGKNITDLVDEYYGKQGITYLTVNSTTAFSICAGFNGTARIASTGADTNWSSTTPWCYIITNLNIVPVPTPGGTINPTIPAYYPMQQDEEDEATKTFPFIILIAIPALLVLLTANYQNNSG